jgi:transcriptional regulator with XRE-family HTH domain
MYKKTVYEKYIEDKEFERLMAQEDLIMDVTESFCALLEGEKVNKSALAKIMGKTKGYISQVLNGGRNLTLRSMADIAYSLGYTVRIAFTKKEAACDTNSFTTSWNVARKNIVSAERFNVTSDDYLTSGPSINRLAA